MYNSINFTNKTKKIGLLINNWTIRAILMTEVNVNIYIISLYNHDMRIWLAELRKIIRKKNKKLKL